MFFVLIVAHLIINVGLFDIYLRYLFGEIINHFICKKGYDCCGLSSSLSMCLANECFRDVSDEYFKGRNFRGFAVFSQIRESLFPRNFSKDVIRESFFPRNVLKKSSSADILKKIHFCSYNIKLWWHS